MKKRIIGMLLAMILVITIIPISVMAASYGDRVPITGYTVVDTMTHNGVLVESRYTTKFSGYDSDPEYCCAALVKRFYRDVYGLTVYGLNASDSRPKPNVDRGTFVLTNTPSVGDIAANAGHWAIVKSVISSEEVMLFEQNYWSDNSTALTHRTLSKNSAGVWWCGEGKYYSEFWFWHYVCDQHQYTTETVDCTDTADGYKKE